MKIRAAVGLIGLLLAGPAFAWQGSTQTGDYRITATFNANRLESVSLTPQSGSAMRPIQLHAWFVDEEGAVLAQASLPNANRDGPLLIAQAKSMPVPENATALVVMAQPAGLTRTAAATQPAVVAEIALR